MLDMSGVVEGIRRWLERLLSEHVILTLRLHPKVFVLLNRSKLEQIVINLCINARDAMPKGGSVSIQVNQFDAEMASELGFKAPAAGLYARLIVSDTGTGIADHVKARIFEPFFTTKPAHEGTGLGLSTVQEFIHESDGHIQMSSLAGAGTTFSLWWPIADSNS